MRRLLQRQVGHFPNDSDDPSKILSPINMFGLEQTAVYSREFAQGAEVCCPDGCGEQRFRTLGINELKEIERDTKKIMRIISRRPEKCEKACRSKLQ